MKEFSHPRFPNIRIQLLHADKDFEIFEQLLLETTDHFTDYKENPPTKEEVLDFFNDLPENVTADKKYLYGIFDDSKLIGFIDWLEDYPTAQQAIIGYFALTSDYRHIGLGHSLYEALEKTAQETGNTCISLKTAEGDDYALAFWTKEGFKHVGDVVSEYGKGLILEKTL